MMKALVELVDGTIIEAEFNPEATYESAAGWCTSTSQLGWGRTDPDTGFVIHVGPTQIRKAYVIDTEKAGALKEINRLCPVAAHLTTGTALLASQPLARAAAGKARSSKASVASRRRS